MRLPIKALRDLGNKYRYSVVVVYAWDAENEMQHIATWGRSITECDQAAQFGDMMKDALHWPEGLHAQPNRVKKLQERIKELERRIEQLSAVSGDLP
jgi:LmbE family N-acetylglucosaminyl deacetylase